MRPVSEKKRQGWAVEKERELRGGGTWWGGERSDDTMRGLTSTQISYHAPSPTLCLIILCFADTPHLPSGSLCVTWFITWGKLLRLLSSLVPGKCPVTLKAQISPIPPQSPHGQLVPGDCEQTSRITFASLS